MELTDKIWFLSILICFLRPFLVDMVRNRRIKNHIVPFFSVISAVSELIIQKNNG